MVILKNQNKKTQPARTAKVQTLQRLHPKDILLTYITGKGTSEGQSRVHAMMCTLHGCSSTCAKCRMSPKEIFSLHFLMHRRDGVDGDAAMTLRRPREARQTSVRDQQAALAPPDADPPRSWVGVQTL